MKTLLITGGAGFIGSHFCKIAKQNGYNPVVFDNLSTGHKEFVKWGDFVEGDLHDYNLLVETFKKYKPLAVIHFAASIEVGESVENPYKYYDNNVVSTLNLLKAMKDCKINNIIFSSTAATFGMPDSGIIDENTKQKPINPYGETKLIVEKMLEDFHKAYGLNYIVLRYFNASGSDPDSELGETHEPPNHIIPIVLEKYKKGEEVKVFGGDWNTKDGTCIRDYIHVNDLAKAHILALKKMISTNQSKKINLGSGSGFSVLEIIKKSEEVVGDKIKYKIVERRAGDPETLVCNNKLAKEYLGWDIEFKDVKSHILHMWNWINKEKK